MLKNINNTGASVAREPGRRKSRLQAEEPPTMQAVGTVNPKVMR